MPQHYSIARFIGFLTIFPSRYILLSSQVSCVPFWVIYVLHHTTLKKWLSQKNLPLKSATYIAVVLRLLHLLFRWIRKLHLFHRIFPHHYSLCGLFLWPLSCLREMKKRIPSSADEITCKWENVLGSSRLNSSINTGKLTGLCCKLLADYGCI